MVGDFNAKSNDWYLNDLTSFKSSQIEFIASQFAMSPVIKEPTHVLVSEVLHRSNTHITN